MLPATPAEWRAILVERLLKRSPRIAILKRYLEGDAPLPEGATEHREAYRAFQRKARTNWGELVVDATAERMRIAGFRVGQAQQDDDRARRIWRTNAMDAVSSDIHRDMLGLGVGYALVTPGDTPRISQETPEQVITDHDPLTGDVRAALKLWTDPTAGEDVAMVYEPGLVTTFRRQAIRRSSSRSNRSLIHDGWDAGATVETGLAAVPVVAFTNRGARGEFETHVDVIDRINWGVLQRLLLVAMQAFRQRALKGDLPKVNEKGEAINWAEVFAPGPDALWNLPSGIDIWESLPTDITPILSASKDDIQHLAAVTRTPMTVFMPDSSGQSAEGAAFLREGLVFKTEDRIARATSAWDRTMSLATGNPDVETLWIPAERQSLAERADAASKAQDIPWRTRMETVWGFSGDQVDRMEAQRASDLLSQIALAPQTNGPANG